MTLEELKIAVLDACERAVDLDQKPSEIEVSLMLDHSDEGKSRWSSKSVELHYDGDGLASGCVLTATI
jgi:hypothetical protein